METLLRNLDQSNRREFITYAARAFLGVSLVPIGGAATALAAPADARTGAKAKSIIYLFMQGGMSHIDTFDTKPERADVQGPTRTISTKADGVRISGYLPELAKHGQKMAIIRSMSHTQGAHEQGEHKVRTGYERQPGLTYPALGSWIARLSGREMRAGLPPFIHVGSLGGQHPGSGFLEAKYGPVPVEDPNSGLRNTRLVKGESLSAIHKRIALATQLDTAFVERYGTSDVRAYADLYADAARLIESKELEAFDLAKELPKTRDAYGQDGFGQGVLLARRLVERGAQFVEVDLGGWDTHTNNHRGVESRAAVLDRALSSLLADLESRGLLATTMVAVVSEFGRSPELDKDAGRNHHPIAFSTMLAGGGVRGGQVYGATDPTGREVIKDKVSVHDFNATIAHLMGINPTSPVVVPGGRALTLAGPDTSPTRGKPIAALI
ncbi:MAG TPA: DUF1501 domain-containing protein [Chthoniobacteraceae bacterium]|nr:DUF1501 domain-containing protein [Chthoniobacteraceae bacterium]